MKSVYATEILILFVSSVGGVCFYNGGWINYLVGSLLVLGTSYFLVSKLKEQTIKEYITKSKNQGGHKFQMTDEYWKKNESNLTRR